MFVLGGLKQGLKAQDKKQYLQFTTKSVWGQPKCFLAYLFRVKEERRVRRVSARSNICIFFTIRKRFPSFLLKMNVKQAKVIAKPR